MPEEKRGRGRPAGRAYSGAKHLRLLADDVTDLQLLAERWRSTESEAIRRAIREAAQRERRKKTDSGAE
jgi:hypothetical protein